MVGLQEGSGSNQLREQEAKNVKLFKNDYIIIYILGLPSAHFIRVTI